jgi:hypothetical protein
VSTQERATLATLEELEDIPVARYTAWQARLALIRPTTTFHWWPKRLKKRQGPRRN